jgi:hypothetical protein
VLGYFYREWNGLTPPSFQGQYKGMNAAAPAFILSVFGVASFFFVPFLVDGLAMLATRRRGVVVIAAVLGLLVAIVPATSYSVEAGRFSGLWALSSKLPLIAGRTAPAIVCLSVFGAVMLAAWALSVRLRDRWMLLAAFAGFMLAQAASFQLWQRYSEPFVLMALAVMACRVPRSAVAEKLPRLGLARVLGPIALAVLLGALAYVSMAKAPAAVKWDFEKEFGKGKP